MKKWLLPLVVCGLVWQGQTAHAATKANTERVQSQTELASLHIKTSLKTVFSNDLDRAKGGLHTLISAARLTAYRQLNDERYQVKVALDKAQKTKTPDDLKAALQALKALPPREQEVFANAFKQLETDVKAQEAKREQEAKAKKEAEEKAKAQKEAEEKAKAQKEAEEKAKTQEAQQEETPTQEVEQTVEDTTRSYSDTPTVRLGNGNSAGSVGTYAAKKMAQATGLPQSTWEYIIARESNGNLHASNPSGAYGLFQTMAQIWGRSETVDGQIAIALRCYNEAKAAYGNGLQPWSM